MSETSLVNGFDCTLLNVLVHITGHGFVSGLL